MIVFGILLMMRKKLKPDGSLFTVYLALYSIWRIGSDFLREGKDFIPGIPLHQAQVIGIIVLVICIVLLIVRKTRWVNEEELVSKENTGSAASS
jgi:phosphatidylglycerol:prolipoprotein diacylglycerol transferase